jgi:hypothetical protein
MRSSGDRAQPVLSVPLPKLGLSVTSRRFDSSAHQEAKCSGDQE